jgi:adenylate cyclase
MPHRRSVTLAQLFLAAALLCFGGVGGAAASFWRSSERAALAASERSRQATARAVEASVEAELAAAASVLDDVERAVASGLAPPRDRRALEALLYTELLGRTRLLEVTYTGAEVVALRSASAEPAPALPSLATEGRFQVSVFWTSDARLATKTTESAAGAFIERRWQRAPGDVGFEHAAQPVEQPGRDPTEHPTFVSSVATDQAGLPVWSDLHFSELDAGQPRPRVVLTVQKAVRSGGALGVVRVGLLTTALDAITAESITANERDPHRVALLAVSGASGAPARLVTRLDPGDPIVSLDDELRVVPRAAPPAVRGLLESDVVRGLDPDWPAREGELDVDGEPWLATLSPLATAGGGTRGWIVAVLVPRSHYTRELVALGHALALPFGIGAAVALVVVASVLGLCRRGLSALEARAARMREFDFSPDASGSPLGEIDAALQGLERAKTVTRALCKYIPVPLVRRLYEKNRDPELGGEQRELSLLFSDIEGFTTLAERLAPLELARRLGQYLEVMTTTLETHGATIDKYIGDAVMAFWNAPSSLDEHSACACRAVLACQRALADLYASPAWAGLPPLVTRFGLHRGAVLVGHFGAPSRLSYTVLGDNVNLAARLEGACKQYHVSVLVSATLAREAGARFEFRPVDRVTVRGKTEAVDVLELIGESARPRGIHGQTEAGARGRAERE